VEDGKGEEKMEGREKEKENEEGDEEVGNIHLFEMLDFRKKELEGYTRERKNFSISSDS
jgi:hypothetical protein